MKWIGLTGGIGTGKSTVSQLLKSRGCPIVDADEIARAVVQPGTSGYAQVVRAFGPGVVSKNGELPDTLNRAELGKIVFQSERARLQLESILHPLIRVQTETRRQELADQGVKVAIYDVPLLFEKNMEKLFDATAVVICTAAQQHQRLHHRDGLSDDEIAQRLAAQLPLAEKVKRADFVIENTGSLGDLSRAVAEFFAQIQR
jgi:dephospho-CoA kinase